MLVNWWIWVIWILISMIRMKLWRVLILVWWMKMWWMSSVFGYWEIWWGFYSMNLMRSMLKRFLIVLVKLWVVCFCVVGLKMGSWVVLIWSLCVMVLKKYFIIRIFYWVLVSECKWFKIFFRILIGFFLNEMISVIKFILLYLFFGWGWKNLRMVFILRYCNWVLVYIWR